MHSKVFEVGFRADSLLVLGSSVKMAASQRTEYDTWKMTGLFDTQLQRIGWRIISTHGSYSYGLPRNLRFGAILTVRFANRFMAHIEIKTSDRSMWERRKQLEDGSKSVTLSHISPLLSQSASQSHDRESDHMIVLPT